MSCSTSSNNKISCFSQDMVSIYIEGMNGLIFVMAKHSEGCLLAGKIVWHTMSFQGCVPTYYHKIAKTLCKTL